MDFVSKRNWFFLLSLLVIAPGIVFLVIGGGLKPGIDFTGGSSLALEFTADVDQSDLRTELGSQGYPDAIVQKMAEQTFFVRTKVLTEESKKNLIGNLQETFRFPPSVQVEFSATGADGLSSVTLKFLYEVLRNEIEDALAVLGHVDATVELADDIYLIGDLDLDQEGRDALVDGLQEEFPPIRTLSFDLVSPVVAAETVLNAFWAVLAAAVGIFFYVWWAFRNVPSPFRYGMAAIIALLHDAMVVVGIFAILGVLFEIEVNTMFLIALLTVIGYSVNDTIVVFDRLRENVLLYPNRTLAASANLSISETLGRSLNTSLTLVFTLAALLLFGGATIRGFLWVLLIGVIAGTYSSLAIATPFLVVWESGTFGRLFRRIRPASSSSAS